VHAIPVSARSVPATPDLLSLHRGRTPWSGFAGGPESLDRPRRDDIAFTARERPCRERPMAVDPEYVAVPSRCRRSMITATGVPGDGRASTGSGSTNRQIGWRRLRALSAKVFARPARQRCDVN